ncbi:TBC1 domain family member 22B, partial [Araneus ventricosus]
MTTKWSTTYVVEKCDVMWKLPHPMLTGGSERQLRKLTFGIDLSNYNVDVSIHSKVAHSTAMKVLSNHSKGNLPFSNNSISDASSTNPSEPSKKSSDSSSSAISSYETKAAALQRLATQKGDISLDETKGSAISNSISNASPLPGPGIGIRQIHKKPSSLFNTQNLSVSSSDRSSEREAARLQMFHKLLNSQNTDLKELRKLSWSGIPVKVRPITWKLLSGYLPTCLERRESFLQRRKEEYQTFVSRYYDIRNEDVHHETYRQIHIDVPRMSPLVPLFQQEIVQMAFERILYILAIRHPASGYVQGMNDLVTPFFVVFLQDFIPA